MKLDWRGAFPKSADAADQERRSILIARWIILAGALTGVRGVVELVRWARRWFVAHELAGATATKDAAAWRELYESYQRVHETLLEGMFLVLAGVVIVATGLWVRHRATCRSARR